MKGKLWTVLAVMVILSLGLAACGPTPEPPTPVPAKETPTAAPAAVPVEDEWGVVTVAKGDPVKIGFAAGLSGAGIDVLGLDEQRGAELAVKDRPEVLGFAVELQVEDAQCNAEGGQTVATKFVADPQIVAVVGHMCSSSCTPASTTYEQNHYTMVSPSCTAPSLTAPDTGTAAFNRVCWNDKIQGPAAARFVYETLGVSKVATVHDGSPYAEQLGQEFTKGFEALGGEIVAAEAVNVGDTDMRPVLTRIKAGEPGLIYFSAFVAEGGYMRSQMADVGMEDVIFMGADGIKADEFIKAAGDAAEGVYASAADFAEAGADYPKFLEAYEAEYGEAPIAPFNAHAYDATMVIMNAIEQVGQVDADGNLLIGRKALNEAIRGTKDYKGLTGTITCDEYGDCGTGTVAVSMVTGGEWVAAEAPAAPALAKVIVGINAEYPPFEEVDDAGNIVGFDADLMVAIAEAAGFEFEFVNTKWDGIFVALAAGEFDAVCSAVTITEERAEIVDFSDPYFLAGQMIVVRADETEITDADSLAGKKAAVQLGTTGDIWLTEETEAEVVRYEENTLAVQGLAAGDVDAAVMDSATAAEIVRANPELNLMLLDGVYTEENYGLAVNKDKPEVLAAINKGLAAIKADGTYDKIYDKYFGVEAPPVPTGEALIIGTTDSVTDLDPAETYDFHTWEIFYNMAGSLLTYIPGTTQLEPELAAEWPTVSDDGLEWTFKLRPDMVFPDGTPVDAHAVKWSVDRAVRLEGDPNWLVSSFLDEAIVVDDLTITFKLQNPVGFFPYLLPDAPWRPVSPNCYSEDGFDTDSTCSGLGPYKIVRWERDVEMELEANPDYPLDPPKWPRIIVRYFADATTMRLALENGEIDVAWKTLLPTDYVDLEDNPDVTVIEGPGAYIRYICFNATTPPFDNIKVKQAISLAIDRDEISDRVYLGTHQPLYSMVPMGMEGHIDAFSKRDLEAAKALLAEAGYSEASPLEMDLWWTTAHYGDTEADVATVIKTNLEETGMIVVSLQSAEWATYTDNFGPGTMPVFLLGWYPDYLDPDNYTWSFAHSEAADDLGIFYASEEMDALLEEAQTESDADKRMELYAQIQELWTTEVPTVPFTQGALYAVTQKNVTGVTLSPTMYFPYFLLEK